MGSIFKSKPQVTTSSSKVDIPPWMAESLKKDNQFREGIMNKGAGIAAGLESDPRTVLGLSGGEKSARDLMWDDYDEAEARSKGLLGGLGGDYTDQYTDDVVDTTLAGMQRQAQRDTLARDSQAASVGGTSNTRAAVGNAVASNLSDMSMAEMEAKLRSDATRWGTETDLADTALQDQIGSGMFNRGMTTGGALGSIAEQGRALDQAGLDEERNAGKDSLSWLAQLFGTAGNVQGPTGQTQTNTTPGTSPFQSILGTAASLGGAWLSSDARGKEDIDYLAPDKALRDVMGLRPAEYRYKDNVGHRTDRHVGLIAQSAEGITGATRLNADDRLEVSAWPVIATIVGAVQQLARERAA